MSLDAFESTINEITDKDSSWWPFLWLRPERHRVMSLRRLASIAVLYGLPLGALLSFGAHYAMPESQEAMAGPLGGFPLVLFFVGSVVVAPMWNRRAERLMVKAKKAK